MMRDMEPSTTARWKRSILLISACWMMGIWGWVGSLLVTFFPGPLLGIFQGGIIGRRRDSRRPQAHVDPGFVHHLEHVNKALVGLPHEESSAIVVFPHA